METFRLIVFIASAISLPFVVKALLQAKIRLPGKTILFLLLAVATRYLLGVVWTPERIWPLYFKVGIASCSATMAHLHFLNSLRSKNARPIVSFAVYMILPLVAAFCFFGSLTGHAMGSATFKTMFWVLWTLMALLMTRPSRAKASGFAKAAVAGIAFVLLALFLSTAARQKAATYVGELKECLRRNVVERWEPIQRSTDAIVAVWDKVVCLDRKAVADGRIGTGKVDAAIKIRKRVARLRMDLLTVDSRAVLDNVSKFDNKIASARKKLSDLVEQRGIHPEKAGKLDDRIAKAEAALAALESDRAAAMAEARRQLKEIGLDLPENSPFLTLDLGELIDNAIVARNIGFVVENLRAAMEEAKGDPEAAKRYYGAYVVMLDVQAECFRQYIDKAGTGIWRDGVTEVAKDAEAAKKGNEDKAAAPGRTEEERKAFLHAAGTNEKTLKVAQAYLAILQRHEEVVREKLAAVEKRHGIAVSFWESADIATSFGSQAVSDMADFEALLELSLPEIAFFDDEAMQEEFDALTRKLARE